MATKQVKVGTLSLPVLAGSLSIGIEHIYSGNSGRNAYGKFIGTLVATKYTISGEFQPMTDAQMSAYLKAVNKPSFEVTFRDPETNADKTITCYRATPKASVYSYSDRLPRYVGCSFEFIEI